MKLATKIKLAVVAGLVLSVPVTIGAERAVVNAHDGDHTVAQEESDDDHSDEAAVYSYTAQEGDSYSLMARKAVQTYGKTHDVRLSLAQIIFAETSLTQEAGAPVLDLGQPVEFSEDEVKSWVEAAGELTTEEKAAWDMYVAGADFNTDHVGEPQS